MKVYFLEPKTSREIWGELPLSYENYRKMIRLFGRDTSLVIGEIETPIARLRDQLVGKMATLPKSLDELGFLARRTRAMTEKEQGVFSAMLKMEHPRSIQELVNLSCNMDKFALYEGVHSKEDLEAYLEKKGGRNDLEKGKRNAQIQELCQKEQGGVFTKMGYVVRTGEKLEAIYGGSALPNPAYEKGAFFCLQLFSSKEAEGKGPKEVAFLSLPAADEKIEVVRKNLGITTMEEGGMAIIETFPWELEEVLPLTYDLQGLNDFAQVLAGKNLLQAEEMREKLFAALEAERPENIKEAAEIAGHMERYVLLDTVSGTKGYAEYAIKKKGIVIEDSIRPFVDFDRFGKWQMGIDGVKETTRGILLNQDHPIASLPEKEEILRLYSPLQAEVYEKNEWGEMEDYPQEITPEQLCWYEREMLKKIDDEWCPEEKERGLALYIRNKILAQKIISMKPTVECWDGKLWGVLEVRSHGCLSGAERDAVCEEWMGQTADGWGEGFEQRPIRIDGGELYVHFWNSGSDYEVVDEQMLKTGIEQKITIQEISGAGMKQTMG